MGQAGLAVLPFSRQRWCLRTLMHLHNPRSPHSLHYQSSQHNPRNPRSQSLALLPCPML